MQTSLGKGVVGGGILISKHTHADKLSHSFNSVYKYNYIKVKSLYSSAVVINMMDLISIHYSMLRCFYYNLYKQVSAAEVFNPVTVLTMFKACLMLFFYCMVRHYKGYSPITSSHLDLCLMYHSFLTPT